MDFDFRVSDKSYKISIEAKEGRFRLNLNNQTFEVEPEFINENCLSFLMDGHSYLVYLADNGDQKILSIGGELFFINRVKEGGEFVKQEIAPGEVGFKEGVLSITAPMPGKVVKISVQEGQRVAKGETLAVVEAMKMEHELRAPLPGLVKKINASEGELVNFEESIMEIEAIH
ncbi:MAG: acetyl-CoA carboxylase biotin carboxyl carrier protein subunit [candidate division KSB1 bacterium]|nr:acetyl-CoA carboxylase biotin carboxyl carrier protein subunit [candidate division KSB1 bacterium]